MKKRTKTLLKIAAVLSAIYAFNKYIETSTTKKHLLTDANGSYYDWKLGRIFYTKQGSGSPVLLIHDALPTASSEEWHRIVKKLEKTHTVYTMDLLGCGRSDKPEISYINYMYVQLINAFIRDVIGQTTMVAATGLSAQFAVMAGHMEPERMSHLLLINPVSIETTQKTPDRKAKLLHTVLNLPLIGTFLYNLATNPVTLNYRNKQSFSAETAMRQKAYMDTYSEAAHLFHSNGKYLFSSMLGNYLNTDIYRAVKEMKQPIAIISSKGNKKNCKIAGKYHMVNPRVQVYQLSTDSPYPQLDVPKKVLKLLEILDR